MADYVNILNTTMSGTVFLEGRARVLKTLDDDRKLVDFEDSCGPVERYVDPRAQGTNIGRYIADLNAGDVSDTPDQS
jgi:hypothetical protein